jgi:hypothetical protein
MEIGAPLRELGQIDVQAVRAGLGALDAEFWQRDRASRTRFAGERPGDAVYFYNDEPPFARKSSLAEAQATDRILVLRNRTYPLFAEVELLVTSAVLPLFPACDLLRVQLAELPAGQTIARHRDGDLLALIHRLHVPLTTNPGVVFTIADADYRLAESVLYELNNAAAHSVRNDGATTRVHLLIDLLPHRVARADYCDSPQEFAACLLAARAPTLARQ